VKNALNGIVVVVVIVLAVLGAIQNNHGTKLSYGACDLYYKEPVTEAKAKSLLGHLKKNGYFAKDRAASVQLLKEGEVYQVRMVVKSDAFSNNKLDMAFQLLLIGMKAQVFKGAKAEIHLCDEKLKTKKVITAPRADKKPVRKADKKSPAKAMK